MNANSIGAPAHLKSPSEEGDGECPVCDSPGASVFFEAASTPANSCILVETPEEATGYPRGEIRLGICEKCGFIWNLEFQPELTEYSRRYEETQGFSETFSTFHEQLASDLIKRYNLKGKDVLEIGCGKGEFLSLLVELGGNRGLGFDPGFKPDRIQGVRRGSVEFRRELFTEKTADVEADFICCKMTLEHIHQPAALMRAVQKVAARREGSVTFFQVPDVTRILEECAFEDVYYEHCSYFGPAALTRLFQRFGFHVLGMNVVYQGQYLTIEASLQKGSEPDGGSDWDTGLSHHLDLVRGFVRRCPGKVAQWNTRLEGFRRSGKRVVLWGSGSKAVSFLTTLGAGTDVEFVVDINPHRQGHFMPGTGHPILAPSHLAHEPPDVVIILNRIYLDEISAKLADLGLSPEVLAL